MATVANNRQGLDGLYKVVYPSGMENAIPDQTILQGQITDMKKVGEYFAQPVVLTMPGGATFGGPNDAFTNVVGAAPQYGAAYDLAQAVNSVSVKLKASGYQMTLRQQIGLGAAKAALGGPESFRDCLGYVFESMKTYGHRLIEQSFLDGQSATGIGVIDTGGYTRSSATVSTFTISAATWAPGRFIGTKGHTFVVAATGPGAFRQTSGNANIVCTITSINYSTRTITAATSGDYTGVVATDVLLWGGFKEGSTTDIIAQWDGTYWYDSMGIMKAAGTTGTVWGQDNTAYELIRGESVAVGSTDLSFDTCSDAMGKLFIKGATGEFTALVSPDTWTNLISPEVAVRRHDSNYKPEKVTVGSEAIEFRHLTGRLKIIAHPMMKAGEAIIYNPNLWTRVGTTDLTFENDQGGGAKKIFLNLATQNGYEVRAFSDQALFTKRLGYTCKLTGITNS